MASMAAITIRFGWVIVLAVLLQKIPFALSAPSSFVELKKALVIVSYVLLLWALLQNRHLSSMLILAVGAALNFLAISANGGLMPVSPGARVQAGMTPVGASAFGNVLPEGTSILLPLEETNLWFLSDIIPISLVGGVFSVGDVVIGVGLLIFFAEVTCSAGDRSGKPI